MKIYPRSTVEFNEWIKNCSDYIHCVPISDKRYKKYWKEGLTLFDAISKLNVWWFTTNNEDSSHN